MFYGISFKNLLFKMRQGRLRLRRCNHYGPFTVVAKPSMSETCICLIFMYQDLEKLHCLCLRGSKDVL